MSKNPAWNAYNEAVRQANQDYEDVIKPLRVKVSEDIKIAEDRFKKKIDPLIQERDKVLFDLKEAYSDKVGATEDIRSAAVKRAADVRNAELAAAKDKKEEATAAA